MYYSQLYFVERETEAHGIKGPPEGCSAGEAHAPSTTLSFMWGDALRSGWGKTGSSHLTPPQNRPHLNMEKETDMMYGYSNTWWQKWP